MDDLTTWKKIELLISRGERETKGVYREALKQIRTELAAVFEKLSEDGKLTRTILNKYNRLGKLEKRLVDKLNDALLQSDRVLQATSITTLKEAFYRYQYIMENELNVKIAFDVFDRRRSIAMLQNRMKEIATKQLRFLGRTRIRRAISQGLEQGLSYRKMAGQIKEAITGTMNDAIRIVRTEAHKAATRGTREQIKNAVKRGIEIKPVWDATLDSRTRSEHQAMDGTAAVWSDDDFCFPSPHGCVPGPGDGGPAGFVINCRCYIRREGPKGPPKGRRAGDKGEREVISWKTYNEWKKERV